MKSRYLSCDNRNVVHIINSPVLYKVEQQICFVGA